MGTPNYQDLWDELQEWLYFLILDDPHESEFTDGAVYAYTLVHDKMDRMLSHAGIGEDTEPEVSDDDEWEV